MFNFNSNNRKAKRAATRRSAPRRGAASRLISSSLQSPASRLRSRRGVLLLVVLSLLILFLMVGTAFVILAKQSEKAAKASGRGAEKSAQAAARGDLIDEVVRQLVRGTKNVNSSIGPHSLLEDMYGNDGFKAAIANPKWADSLVAPSGANLTRGQMLEFTLAPGTLVDMYGNVNDGGGLPLRLSPLDSAYNGQTLTFLNGPAANRSTRIVGYFARDNGGVPVYTFRVMNVQLADGSIITNPTQLLSTVGPTRILVNGRPFNGTGAGFNPWAADGTPKLNAEETVGGAGPYPLALLPNAAFMQPSQVSLPGASMPPYFPLSALNIFDYNGRGGADESYDAVDFQNMALAYVPATTLVEEAQLGGPGLSVRNGSMVLPSFHRPELLNYWSNLLGTGSPLASNGMMLRKVLLRPNWIDHPDFTGSNPEFSMIPAARNAANDMAKLQRMIFGPWDVDNDNDGVRDSVWIDVGLPVMAGPHGKLVKPLAAILCIDMDGRLNVNAHGSLDLAQSYDSDMTRLSDSMQGMVPPLPGGVLQLAGVNSSALPRGLGFGPADVSLEFVLDPGAFANVLRGTGTIPGRYGPDGGSNVKRAGLPGQLNVLSRVSKFGWPDVIGTLSSFVTPPDLLARYSVGLNYFGQPMFEANYDQLDGRALAASPYEINLSRKTAAGVEQALGQYADDAPFSVAELEAVLRVYDADSAKLPSRLENLSGVRSNLDRRLKITTDSFDLPAPNVALPHELHDLVSTNVNYARQPRSTAELIEIRVRAALSLAPFPMPLTDPDDAAKVRNVVRQLVAPELAAGERLNLNRPLGNGADDNNNGVVDEPGELTAGGMPTPVWKDSTVAAIASFQTAVFPPMATDFRPAAGNLADPNPQPVDVDHRQLLARHLYVMELTLAAGPTFGNGTNAQADRELATRLAQWAVNTVDFRDADNIMTGFEFDVNPFNGWDVDGELNASSADNSHVERGVVWGLERPELVITETAAWHDRRTDDTGQADSYPPEDGYDSVYGTDDKDDKDYDQLVRPRGALLVEVHNPWPSNPAAQADTHRKGAAGGGGPDMGVDLARKHDNSPPNQSTGSPVWRMAIYKRNGVPADQAALWDPDDPDPKKRPSDKMDRAVYFCGPQANFPDEAPNPSQLVPSFTSDLNPTNPTVPFVPPVRPGRFLVIGGADSRGGGVYELQLGDRSRRNNRTNTRRIELDTSVTAQHAVRMVDIDNNTMMEPTAAGPLMSLEAPSEVAVQAATTMGPAYQGDSTRSFTDVAIIDHAIDQPGDRPVRRRLTISEPAIGYPDDFPAIPPGSPRVSGAKWNEGAQEYRAEGAPRAIDIPLDGPIGGGDKLRQYLPNEADWPFYLKPKYGYVSVAGGDPVLTQIRDPGSNADPGASYSFIYLQRLANPLLPWNPEPGHPRHQSNQVVNPYMTVDSSSVNLTVFNSRGTDTVGYEGQEEPVQLPPPKSPRPDGPSANDPGGRFASHERGHTEIAGANGGATNMPTLWKEETPSAERTQNPRRGIKLLTTPDGYLRNPRPGSPRQPPNLVKSGDTFTLVPRLSLGFLNRTFQDTAAAGEARKVKPKSPYEWLTWNNRPYASGNELMLVPRLRSSQILKQFSNGEPLAAGGDPPSPYDNATGALDAKGAVVQTPQPAFAHLENFFFQPPQTAGVEQPAPRGTAAHLYRLLEYVHAPSLFAGTETWLNPQYFQATPITDPADPRASLEAPFNTVSEFRDPGRVNVNTIAGSDVWKGLFHGRSKPDGSGDPKAHPGPDDDYFAASRRGYGPPDSSEMLLEATMPTLFANPFRSPDAGDLVPLSNMMHEGVDVTIQRRYLDAAGAPTDRAMFAAETNQSAQDSRRNSFHRYQPMTRLGSMITTRSNVYAVWVTIGYFEVEPAPPWTGTGAVNQADFNNDQNLYNRVYPDGYQFGKEDGVETGDIRRLRGFYILDRTIPAGFEPGADHNAEDVIRLRRRIE